MTVRDQIEARIGGLQALASFLDAGPELPPLRIHGNTVVLGAYVQDTDELARLGGVLGHGAPHGTIRTQIQGGMAIVSRGFGGGVCVEICTDYKPPVFV